MSEADEHRLVHCKKLEEELPGLTEPPFRNDFGTWVYDNISKQAWDMWLTESVRYINTYRVDLSSEEGSDFMYKQLRIWIGLEDGEMAATAWKPPEES
ncbi:MAG: Fe(2+)-trafficking protein [Myxococcota bacterium]